MAVAVAAPLLSGVSDRQLCVVAAVSDANEKGEEVLSTMQSDSLEIISKSKELWAVSRTVQSASRKVSGVKVIHG